MHLCRDRLCTHSFNQCLGACGLQSVFPPSRVAGCLASTQTLLFDTCPRPKPHVSGAPIEVPRLRLGLHKNNGKNTTVSQRCVCANLRSGQGRGLASLQQGTYMCCQLDLFSSRKQVPKGTRLVIQQCASMMIPNAVFQGYIASVRMVQSSHTKIWRHVCPE